MRCGISTACFYPQETADALACIAAAGVPVTEVFLNTFHELEDEYVQRLQEIIKNTGIQVVSVHPFTSAMEGFFFATDYKGRMEDGLRIYRRYFEVCSALGASKLVFHGDHSWNIVNYSFEQYANNFVQLATIGKEYGVTLCHENVSYCRLGSPENVRQLRPLLGDNAAFVLDTKQVRRFDAPLEEMLNAMGDSVRHVHISDYDATRNCILPGRGELDIKDLLCKLNTMGYSGDLMIELYRDGFEDLSQLLDAMKYVNRLIRQTEITGLYQNEEEN